MAHKHRSQVHAVAQHAHRHTHRRHSQNNTHTIEQHDKQNTARTTEHSNMIILTRCTITTTRITRITTIVHISTINPRISSRTQHKRNQPQHNKITLPHGDARTRTSTRFTRQKALASGFTKASTHACCHRPRDSDTRPFRDFH